MAKAAQAASTSKSWAPGGLAGLLFTVAAIFLAATSLKSNPVALGIAAAVGAVGLLLLTFAAGELHRLYLGAKAATPICGTIVELRREVVRTPNSRLIRWKVVARGTWPDGTSDDFQSAPLKIDPEGAFLPGQSVTVHADVRSRVYRMDLATVAGASRPAAEMRPPAPAGTPVQRPLQPGRGLAAGLAMMAAGVGLYALDRTALPAALMVGAFGLLVCVLVYLGLRTQRRIAEGGAVFDATVDRIVHTVVHSGARSFDQWSVQAVGSWPDGLRQTFQAGEITQIGSLKEGDRVRVRGDATTRTYEIDLAGGA